MKNVLLIGGPADGRRVQVIDELATIYMYQYPEAYVQLAQQFDGVKENLVYDVTMLAGRREKFWIGVYREMDVDMALEYLLDGYRK